MKAILASIVIFIGGFMGGMLISSWVLLESKDARNYFETNKFD